VLTATRCLRLRQVWLVVLLVSTATQTSAEQDPILETNQVVVTAPSADGTLRTTAHGVSVITAADIARSNATSVGDLLSRQANLNLQSFYGSDKGATIDIRGMGASAASNVLVLVDGVRLNDIDLSGPALSTIPMSQIERVEIVRGGGAVRYGSGAVGGVVNIITKSGAPGATNLDLLAQVGSYATTDFRVNASAGAGPLVATVNASKFNTDGYRENGGINARDGMVQLALFPKGTASFFDAYVSAAVHHDTSGLPGPVSAEAFAAGPAERRASSFPFDTSTTDAKRYTMGANADFGRAGLFSIQANYIDRENPFIIGYSPLIPVEDQQSLITSTRKDLKAEYSWQFPAFGFTQTASIGVDLEWANYQRDENGEFVLDSSFRRTGTADSQGYFATTTLKGPSGLTFNGGIRLNRFSTNAVDQRYGSQCQSSTTTVLIDVDPGPGVLLVPVQIPVPSNCSNAYRDVAQQGGDWINHGIELGLTWQASEAVTAFASFAANFRDPNVDELLLAATDLQPQTGRTYELGLRYTPNERVELSATGFLMRINNEIYYGIDPATGLGVNRNFDSPTRRVGVELEARWRASPTVALRTSLGYLVPTISGSYADIPLVPRSTAYAEVVWTPRGWALWSLSARYVGKRFDGNDITNTQYPPLPSYLVVDTALRFTRGNTQISVGINNLFNEVYSTIAYSGTYYPMPGRNYYLQLQWHL